MVRPIVSDTRKRAKSAKTRAGQATTIASLKAEVQELADIVELLTRLVD